MMPTINGKSFMDCSEADLQILIDNPDFREGDYLDYKSSLSFLDIPKNDSQRLEHIAEFRSDVCQFANADGGYLIYGIKDKKGLASEIVGIDIPGDNTDKFELERKNNLVPIMPKIPSVKFKFIPLASGKIEVPQVSVRVRTWNGIERESFSEPLVLNVKKAIKNRLCKAFAQK